MIDRLLQRFCPRELILLVLTLVIIAAVLLVQLLIMPLTRDMQDLRSQLDLLSADHTRLKRNVAVAPQVQALTSELDASLQQRDSDEVMVFELLRDVETKARHPSLRIVNMRPLPPKPSPAYRTFEIRVTGSGKVQELLQFMTDLCNSSHVIGVKSLSLRGAHGVSNVDFTLSLWTVRFPVSDAEVSKVARNHGAL